jgi:hypothetical protein
VKKEKLKYKCPCCGIEYDEIPLCFGFEYPEFYYSIPTDEISKRVDADVSLMVIDEKHFFHRCRLTIPINNHDEDLIFNVWLSISKDNFIKRNEIWNNPERVNEEPYFGWLQSLLPLYDDTINIKAIAREKPIPYIPEVEIIEDNHPIQKDQQNGISLEWALKFVDFFIESSHKNN